MASSLSAAMGPAMAWRYSSSTACFRRSASKYQAFTDASDASFPSSRTMPASVSRGEAMRPASRVTTATVRITMLSRNHSAFSAVRTRICRTVSEVPAIKMFQSVLCRLA